MRLPFLFSNPHNPKVQRSRAEQYDLVVALGTAVVVIALLHLCSHQRVTRILERWAKVPSPPEGSLGPTEVERRLWAVEAVSHRLLPHRPCLTQALTAKLLVAQRGAQPTEMQPLGAPEVF